jgi:hypothetical protein
MNRVLPGRDARKKRVPKDAPECEYRKGYSAIFQALESKPVAGAAVAYKFDTR